MQAAQALVHRSVVVRMARVDRLPQAPAQQAVALATAAVEHNPALAVVAQVVVAAKLAVVTVAMLAVVVVEMLAAAAVVAMFPSKVPPQ